MAYFLDTVIPDNAVFLFFSKAEQFGLFGTMTPVKGYVNKKTGKPVAPYTGLRRRALKKPDHPLSGNLFGHAGDEVASSHIQPEPVKVKKPRKLSPEKLAAFKAKIAHVVAHAKVDAQHAPKQGEVHKKLYLAKLESIKGIPAELLDEAKQNVEGLFKPKTLTAEPPQGQSTGGSGSGDGEPPKDSNAFVASSSGSIDFGRIAGNAAIAIKQPEGPIRLQAGFHNDATGRGFGKVHIDRDLRATELAQNGYSSTEALIEDVAQHFTAIYEGKNNSFILVKENGKAKIAFVSVKQDKDGVFYSVGSGLVSRTDYLKKKSRLWERAQSNQPKPPSAISGQQPGSISTLPPPAPKGKAAPPHEQGAFGPIFRQFRHDAQGAIAHLKQQQTGEAVAALYHPEVGDIDLVWGKKGTAAKDYEDGHGLAKIITKHPEVVDNLQGILDTLKGVPEKSTHAYKVLESHDHKALIRLDWDRKTKTWLLTAFEKKQKGGAGSGTIADTAQIAGQGDTARLTTRSNATLPTTAPEGKAAPAQPTSDTRDPDAEFLQTERAYGGRAAFKRALDAGKTKLNYRQWVQVRTPAFKQWFGDWENDAKLNLGIDALRQLADGKDEVTIQGIKPELKQFGGDSNIHLVWGDDKKGILHIGKKRGFERVAKVVAAALLGNQFDYAPAKKTVRVTHDGHTAVLSLDEHGKQKTWLLTGWEDGKPDAAGEVSATTGATHHTPTFSRGVMGAGLINSIDQILPRGASKVVDDNGEPLVVYHGTSADFSEFSENAERLPWNADGAGHYFTSSKDSAAGYGDFVMPVFLRAKTPKISENFEHTKVTADQIKKLNGQGFDSIYFSGEYQNSSGKTVQGYDEYVAFAPTQIKSALGNRGAFDAKSPDITKAWHFPKGARFLFYRAAS